jgi:hypothetical protein
MLKWLTVYPTVKAFYFAKHVITAWIPLPRSWWIIHTRKIQGRPMSLKYKPKMLHADLQDLSSQIRFVTPEGKI